MKLQMTVNYDLSKNFWELNPELTIPGPFAKLYKLDSSGKKSESSKIMWGIYLYIHPKSKFKDLGESARRKLVIEDWLKDPKFRWDKIETEVNTFKDLCLSRAQRFLIDWEKKLEERQSLIAQTPYDLSNAEDLDKMLARTDKLWDQYRQCLKDVEDEDTKGNVRGGAVESLGEQNLI